MTPHPCPSTYNPLATGVESNLPFLQEEQVAINTWKRNCAQLVCQKFTLVLMMIILDSYIVLSFYSTLNLQSTAGFSRLQLTAVHIFLSPNMFCVAESPRAYFSLLGLILEFLFFLTYFLLSPLYFKIILPLSTASNLYGWYSLTH